MALSTATHLVVTELIVGPSLLLLLVLAINLLGNLLLLRVNFDGVSPSEHWLVSELYGDNACSVR